MKLGDITIKEFADICFEHLGGCCEDCPLSDEYGSCDIITALTFPKEKDMIEREINPQSIEQFIHNKDYAKDKATLKVAKILKEKRVDLCIFDCIDIQEYSNDYILDQYNRLMPDYQQLTLKEVTAIVEWLKGE